MLLLAWASGLNLLLVWKPQPAAAYVWFLNFYPNQLPYTQLNPFIRSELEVIKTEPLETSFWTE